MMLDDEDEDDSGDEGGLILPNPDAQGGIWRELRFSTTKSP